MTLRIASVLFLIVVYTSISAQNTLALEDGSTSPSAIISDVAWIAGHWLGEAFGGVVEEVWTEPLGGSMMASFKLVVDSNVSFYEIITITEENKSLMVRLKHFDKNLKGWEEKDETINFPLVKISKDFAYFDGMTFEKVSANEMNVYVRTSEEKGKTKEIKFNYKRKM